MPNDDITNAEYAWMKEVYKANGWKLPVQKGDPQEEGQLDHAPAKNVHFSGENTDPVEPGNLTPSKDDTSDKLDEAIQRLRIIEQTLENSNRKEPLIPSVDDRITFVKNRGEAEVARASARLLLQKSPDLAKIHISEVNDFLNTAEDHLKHMKSLIETGRSNSEKEIDKYKLNVIECNSNIKKIYAHRGILENWGIDLSEFDAKYTDAIDNISRMNTAINGNTLLILLDEMGKAPSYEQALLDVFHPARDAASTAQEAARLRASKADRDIAKVYTMRSELKADPEQMAAFDNAYSAAIAAAVGANAAIKELHGIKFKTSIRDTERSIAEMQKIIIQAMVRSPSETLKSRDDEYWQRLVGDVANQSTIVETLYEKYGSVVPSFQRSYQSACYHIVAIQFDLINRNHGAAQLELVELNGVIEEMEDFDAQYHADLDTIQPKIKLLRKQLNYLEPNRKEFEKLADLNKSGAKDLDNFDAAFGEAAGLINYAEFCMKTGRIIDANQAIANSEESLKIVNKVIATLKYSPKISSAPTKGEMIEMHERAIMIVRDDLDELNNKRDVFKDNEELQIFDKSYDKTNNYVDQAQNLLNQQKLSESEDVLDNARIALEGLKTIFERGLKTAANIPSYLKELKELKSKIYNFRAEGNSLRDPEYKAVFLDYKKHALNEVRFAESLFHANETKNARTALENLKSTVSNLEETFIRPPKKSRRNAVKRKGNAYADKADLANTLNTKWNYIQHWFSEKDHEKAEKLMSDLYSSNVTDQVKAEKFKQLHALTIANYGANFKIVNDGQHRAYSLLDYELKFDIHAIDLEETTRKLKSSVEKESSPEIYGAQFMLDLKRMDDGYLTIDSIPADKKISFAEISKQLAEAYSAETRTAIFAICHQGIVGLLAPKLAVMGSSHELTFAINKNENGDVKIRVQFEKDMARDMMPNQWELAREELITQPDIVKKSIRIDAEIEIQHVSQQVKILYADILSQNDASMLSLNQ